MNQSGRPARVYIPSPSVSDRLVQGKEGKEFQIRSQVGYLYGHSPMGLLETEINLDRDDPPYGKGVYEISGSSFEVKGFSRLSLVFGGIRLVRCSDDDPAALHCLRMVDALHAAQADETERKAGK